MAVTVQAQTYTALTPTTCPTNSTGLFTTGQQYVDPSNGVLKDRWSMLVRWQGNPSVGNTQWVSDSLSYNLGTYTGYTPPLPYSAWERGYQPESQASATPGVELHGCDAGMLLNSWQTPHAGLPVVGGGFNDMYGYAWSNPPYAFKALKTNPSGVFYWVSSDLVLQGKLAVPQIGAYRGVLTNGTWQWSNANIRQSWTYGTIGYSLFAYIVDTTHPNLHPIAILATAYINGSQTSDVACANWSFGNIAFDYAPPVSPNGTFGVWFASVPFCTTDISTADPTSAASTVDTSANLAFYRIHITPGNLTAIVNRINGLHCGGGTGQGTCKEQGVENPPDCVPGSTCPANGYSTDPSVYKVQYVGVLGEIGPCDDPPTDTAHNHVSCSTNLQYPGNFHYNPNQDSNVGAAFRASNVAAYSYTVP